MSELNDQMSHFIKSIILGWNLLMVVSTEVNAKYEGQDYADSDSLNLKIKPLLDFVFQLVLRIQCEHLKYHYNV